MNKRINQGKGSITISTSVAPELYWKAQKYGIKWSEALRRGLVIIMSEIGDTNFNNPFLMAQKVETLALKLDDFSKENEKLREQLKTMKIR